MRATYKGVLLAESDDTIVVEGNHYFPRESLVADCFSESDLHSTCPWKGVASYLNVEIDGEQNKDAAWYYPETKPIADKIKGRVAFWRGVIVE